MRTARLKQSLFAATLLAGIFGYAAHTDALYHIGPDSDFSLQTWGRDIPVCFNTGPTPWPGFSALRATAMNAIARTWTQETGLRFTGWQPCPKTTGTPKTINIGYNTFNKGCDAAQTTTLDGRVDLIICPPAWNDLYIIHEFGHALGFDHEMDRPDFLDYLGCEESNTPGGNVFVTIPDVNSIMNGTYCHQMAELSYFDISGAQNRWGRPNYFADVNGDGRADAIVVNPNGVFVRMSDANGMMPASSQRLWTTDGGFWGWMGTHFADVNGDRRADLIAVDPRGVAVRLSTGASFGPATFWHTGAYYGQRGTHFADVNGDGRADAVVINNDSRVFVALSDGRRFVRDKYWLAQIPNDDRESKNYFADVTGADPDGRRRADLVAVNFDGLVVCPALVGGGFGSCHNWTWDMPLGSRGRFFADYNGDGRDDAILIDGPDGTYGDVRVRLSNGQSFGFERWQISGLRSERGIQFANVDSNAAAEAIAINNDGVWVMGAKSGVGLYNATGNAFYGLR